MKLRALDGLRGMTALYVVVFHASGLLWTSVRPEDGAVPWLYENLVSFGHQAVLVFFLISGFCIHYRQAKTGARRIHVRQFGWRRVKRLYPSLLLALLITAALDHIGMLLNPGYYTIPRNFWDGPVTVGGAYSLHAIVGNLLLQARLFVPELGSNSPLWSLAFEFWFYMLYPLMLRGFRLLGAGRMTALAGALSIVTWLFLDGSPLWSVAIFEAWSIWVFGALLAESYVRGEWPRILRYLGPAAPAILVFTALLSPLGSGRDWLPDVWWGAVFALMLAYLMLAHNSLPSRVFERVCLACGRLGEISYSLYLVHYPLLALMAAGWIALAGQLPAGIELTVAGVLLSLGLGWLAWYAVERHCVPRRAETAERTAAQIASPAQTRARSTSRVGHARTPAPRALAHTRMGPITRASLGTTGRVLASRAAAGGQHRAPGRCLPGDPARTDTAAGLVTPT